jgi:hypothetical protein
MQFRGVRRTLRKLDGERAHIYAVTPLKCGFTDAMLLHVVLAAQADRPPIGWLQSDSAIGIRADMGTLDR